MPSLSIFNLFASDLGTCMAIDNVSVRYKGGFLPDIILLLSNSFKCHEEFFVSYSLSSHLLNALTIFPPDRGMLRRYRWVHIFLQTLTTTRRIETIGALSVGSALNLRAYSITIDCDSTIIN